MQRADLIHFNPDHADVIRYSLVCTNQRLTFDIEWQAPRTIYRGPDDGPYFAFTASNGYQVISRSRMDIQTERLCLLGATGNERSGSMVFSSNEKRDRAREGFMLALDEWCAYVRAGKFGTPDEPRYFRAQFLGNADDAAVDPRPMFYQTVMLETEPHLRRVLATAESPADWIFGVPRRLADFARVGPISIEAMLAEWQEATGERAAPPPRSMAVEAPAAWVTELENLIASLEAACSSRSTNRYLIRGMLLEHARKRIDVYDPAAAARLRAIVNLLGVPAPADNQTMMSALFAVLGNLRRAADRIMDGHQNVRIGSGLTARELLELQGFADQIEEAGWKEPIWVETRFVGMLRALAEKSAVGATPEHVEQGVRNWMGENDVVLSESAYRALITLVATPAEAAREAA
jgi:hypothetical protein